MTRRLRKCIDLFPSAPLYARGTGKDGKSADVWTESMARVVEKLLDVALEITLGEVERHVGPASSFCSWMFDAVENELYHRSGTLLRVIELK